MSHARPLPDAAIPPWPEQPSPPPPHGASHADIAAKADDSTPQTRANAARWAAAGVGIGIGSAALVAAFLFASRPKAKK